MLLRKNTIDPTAIVSILQGQNIMKQLTKTCLLGVMVLLAACVVSKPEPVSGTPTSNAPVSDVFEAPNHRYGIGGNPAITAIGGGKGYGDWVAQEGAVLVSTKEELLNALKTIAKGGVIYIDDRASIDLTGESNLRIPAGVTLASGRGRVGSLGAHLYTTANENTILFVIRDSGVRITGLRLQGPSVVEKPGGCPENARGILVRGTATQLVTPTVEIDNNELWGWPNAAITIAEMPGVHVHHNSIHHNRRVVEDTTTDPEHGCAEGAYGLGYGVNISGTHVLVDANRFNDNRHDIASSGSPASGYTARYNLVLSYGTSHSFDMHGFGEQRSIGADPPYEAGDRMVIHHNTFLITNYPAIVIRGIPRSGAWIYQNQFAGLPETIMQRNVDAAGTQYYPPNTVNLHVEDNQYEGEPNP